MLRVKSRSLTPKGVRDDNVTFVATVFGVGGVEFKAPPFASAAKDGHPEI
jgi:hypothetical protein